MKNKKAAKSHTKKVVKSLTPDGHRIDVVPGITFENLPNQLTVRHGLLVVKETGLPAVLPDSPLTETDVNIVPHRELKVLLIKAQAYDELVEAYNQLAEGGRSVEACYRRSNERYKLHILGIKTVSEQIADVVAANNKPSALKRFADSTRKRKKQ